jgi:MoxR-like ATPase
MMTHGSDGIAVSPEAVMSGLAELDYLADEGLATAIFLAIRLGKPLLLEGAPGVGKTEAAKSVAKAMGSDLVRLQCYEGIDAAHALYEWNYQRQLLAIRQTGDAETDIYGDRFLIARPLLQVLQAPERRLLLVDEIDRSDHEFEALLLEFLSDFQISIPERGTIRATARPLVVLTSNRTRELAEALRRRCVYHWIGYPDAEREAEIIMARAGDVARETAHAVASAVQTIRSRPLAKPPGIAEAIEWANAATILEKGGSPWPEAFRRAIGVLIKDEEDVHFIEPDMPRIIEKAMS